MNNIMVFLEVLIVILLVADLFLIYRRKRNERKADETTRAPQNRESQDNQQIPAVNSAKPAPSAPEQMVQVEDIGADDLLREGQIYLQYGHYAQAATVLRWYVDMRPNDTRAINYLLDAYISLEDLEAYSTLLSYMGEQVSTPFKIEWWKERVECGLREDPGNLELLVLAEKIGVPISSPDSAQHEKITAAKALVLVSRNQDPVYGRSVLLSAIQTEPLRLQLYAELLRINHKEHNLEAYLNALILLDIALGTQKSSIRERMLRAGRNLGTHPLWDRLEQIGDNHSALRALAAERHLAVSPNLPS